MAKKISIELEVDIKGLGKSNCGNHTFSSKEKEELGKVFSGEDFGF